MTTHGVVSKASDQSALQQNKMPAASNSNIHGHVHGIVAHLSINTDSVEERENRGAVPSMIDIVPNITVTAERFH